MSAVVLYKSKIARKHSPLDDDVGKAEQHERRLSESTLCWIEVVFFVAVDLLIEALHEEKSRLPREGRRLQFTTLHTARRYLGSPAESNYAICFFVHCAML